MPATISEPILSNYPEFARALNLYVQAQRLTFFESVKKKMGDLAFQAAKFTTYRDGSEIKQEILSLPITKDNGKKRYGDTSIVGALKLMNWERKNRGRPAVGNSMYAKTKSGKRSSRQIRKIIPRGPALMNRFADGKLEKFYMRRLRSSKFLRIGWAVASEMLGKPFEKGDFGPETIQRLSSSGLAGAEITSLSKTITKYRIFNACGQIDHRYDPVRPRSQNDISKARTILQKALDLAANYVTKDMNDYISTRLHRIWNHNGKYVKE